MTPQSKPIIAEKEARMQEAIEAHQKAKKKNITKIAATYKVSRTTLNLRVNGRKSRRESLQHRQALSPAEEYELVRWISKLTITGYAPRHPLVRQMAESIRKRRTRPVNDETIELVQYPPLGEIWVRNFLDRHSHLKTVVGKTIESSRIEGTTHAVLQPWFDAYRKEISEDPEVLMENIYNMDESGFSIGAIKAGRVIIDSKIRTQFQANPGRQEWLQ